MKRNKLFFTLSGFLLLTFIIVSLSINVKAANTLDFIFEKDFLYENVGILPLNETFNVRNQTVYTENYFATYSFENDEHGSNPLNFTVDETGGTINVLDNYDGHNKVVEMDDTSDSAAITLDTNVSRVSGTYEYWMRFSQITGYVYHYILDTDTAEAINLQWTNNGEIKFYNTSWNVIGAYVSNVWYHVSIDFECGSGNYLGLSEDTFNLKINSKQIGSYEMRGNPITMEKIRWTTSTTTVSIIHIDALGYSWDKTFYTNEWFDLSGECAIPFGITWNGDSFWITDDAVSKVFQYSSEGVYTSEYFDTSTQDIYPIGITWDGNSFWIVGSNSDKVYKYYANGTYTETYFDVSTEDTVPEGITWDGNSFWIVGSNTHKVYQYTSEGVYTTNYFDVGAQDNIAIGITLANNSFWIIGDITDKVYQYTNEGIYTTNYFDVGAEDTSPKGIVLVNSYFWIVGAVSKKAYKYQYVEFPYNIGDNIFPYIQTNNSLEVDKYEFALKNVNEFYDVGNLNPSTWDMYTQGTGSSQIGAGLEPTKDKVVVMFGSGTGNNFGIKKTDFTYTEKIIDVNFGLYFVDWSGSNSFFVIEIDSSDGTGVVALAIYNDGRFAYIDDGAQIFRTDIDVEINYDIGLHINYYHDLCYVYYSVEGVLIEIYVIDLLVLGKTGLKEINILSSMSGTEFTMLGLDYVGVYANGLSDAGEAEYGYLTIDLEKPNRNWNIEHYNNFTIIASGKFALYACEGTYSIEESIGLVLQEIKHNNTKLLFNLYETGFTDLDNPFLIVYLSDNIFNNISYLNVEGIKLSESLNTYYSSYSFAGVILNESYFWVDSNNKLQFILTVDDNNLEYLQITFNVNNIPSKDRSVSFISDISGDSKGLFSIDYISTTSSIFEFLYYETTTRVILPQTKTIDKFTILITDNNKDNNDLCIGYISDIKLLYNPDIEITIIISTLIKMIIPLIVMILPAIIMNKKFGVVGVIATFILMSLICVIANLIPIWMFFIIIFGSITFLLVKRERGGIK